MQTLEIKATVARSNPQIIREFWLEEKRTFKDLYDTICITLGWKKTEDFLFEKDGRPFTAAIVAYLDKRDGREKLSRSCLEQILAKRTGVEKGDSS